MKDEKLIAGTSDPGEILSLTRSLSPVLLAAEPRPLQIDLQRTAVMVIDMQHTFVSKGGKFDLRGEDVLKIQTIIEPIKRITGIARAKRIRVIYVAHHHTPNFQDSGGPDSPNWYKGGQLDYREHPDWRDKINFAGRWGAEIVEELKPEQSDLLVIKPRYSAFFGTRLDMILRTYGIKYLLFVGVATNICVEGTIRDAFNLDYFPILISDATMSSGPSFMQEATIYNVKTCFGWVTNTDKAVKAMKAKKA